MPQTICLTLPLLPGAAEVDRDEMLACWRGERASQHRESRARHGITREATWIQPTPAGDVVIVLLESGDLAKSLFGIATSTEPFDIWFRAHVKAVHGVDLAAGMQLPEQILDYSAKCLVKPADALLARCASTAIPPRGSGIPTEVALPTGIEPVFSP